MRKNIFYYFFLFGTIIPSILLASCSDNSRFIQKSSKNKPWLGVQVKEISKKMSKNFKIDYGLEVIRVYDGSPAEEAGLEKEDILLTFNNEPLSDIDELIDMVQSSDVDEVVSIEYMRDGEKYNTKATIEGKEKRSWKKSYGWRFPDKDYKFKYHYRDERAWLGVSTTKLAPQLRKYFNVPEDFGVLINEVIEDSPAEEYGLEAGDVIIRVDGEKISNHWDLVRTIDDFEPDDEIKIEIIRKGKEKTIEVKLGKHKGPYRHHFGLYPESFEIIIPEIEFEIPDIEIDIPPIDREEIEEINETLREEIEINSDELKEQMKELQEKLKEIKIDVRNTDSKYI